MQLFYTLRIQQSAVYIRHSSGYNQLFLKQSVKVNAISAYVTSL